MENMMIIHMYFKGALQVIKFISATLGGGQEVNSQPNDGNDQRLGQM